MSEPLRPGGRPTEPYTPPRRRSQRNRAVVVGSLILIAFAAGLMYLVVDFASEQPDKVDLPGGDTFVVGSAERFAERIDSQRAPILFKDPLSSSAGREIYVLHDGDDIDAGWYAVLAYAPGAERSVECLLQWDIEEQHFEDPCGEETYDADDPSLIRFEAEVNSNRAVEVDLRSASDDSTTEEGEGATTTTSG